MSNTIGRVLAILSAIIAVNTDPANAVPVNDVVPEPSTWILLGTGVAGLAAWRWYRSR